MKMARYMTAAVALAVVAGGVAQAGVYNNNFDTNLGGAAVDGTTNFPPTLSSYMGNSAVQLVDAVNGRFGSIQLPVLDGTSTVNSFAATIGYATPNIQSGGTNSDTRIRGTGLGLFFGQYANGQDMDRRGPIGGGTANGLSIELDIVQNSTPAGFRVYVNDVLVATNTSFSPGVTDIRGFTVQYQQTNPAAGSLTLSYANGTTPTPVIFSAVSVPFVPEVNDRFSINGSTDDDTARVFVTDANITTTIPEPTALAGLAAVAGLALRRRSR